MDFFTIHWQGNVALLALIVSVVSTTISFYTFRLQRKHNIKSVKPIIHIGQWDYEDKIYVTLNNVGTGLAIVNKLRVSNAQQESRNNLYEWLPKKLHNGVNYAEYWTPYKTFVIQPNQIIKLVEIPIDTTLIEQVVIRENLRAILGELIVLVEYQDIYDNVMPLTKVELTHFDRIDNINTEY